MGIFSITGRLFRVAGKKVEYGRLIGTSKNGIKVYSKVGQDGEKIITSLNPNGSIHKEITKANFRRSNGYVPVTGHRTTVQNHDTNKIIRISSELQDNPAHMLKTHTISEYNALNDRLIESRTQQSILGFPYWSRIIHERPSIRKITESFSVGNYRNVKKHFELNNFKFPGGAVHNGCVGYEKGITGDRQYLKKYQVNPFYDNNIDIKYPKA